MKVELMISAPPVAVAGWTFLGHSLPEWAAFITIIYTLVLFLRLVIRWIKGWAATGDPFNVD